MSSPIDEDKELVRNRKTLMLLVGGAVSLVIPLLGVAYMHWKDVRSQVPAAAPAMGVFEHRADGSSAPLSPALTPAPDGPAGNRLAQVPQMAPRDSSPAPLQPGAANSQTAGSSLSMVRGSDDYYQQQQAAAPAAPPQQQPAAPPQPQAPAPAADAQAGAKVASVGSLKGRQPAKPAYKPFNAPHLQGSRFGGGSGGQQGMAGMGSGGMPGGANNPAAAMAAMQQMGGGQGGVPNMGAMMQQMQGAAGQGGQGGMPNMGAMMQQMQGAAGQGGQGGMPNMGAMMQQMQGAQGQGGQGAMPNMGAMMQQMQGQQQH
jgi:hypothetical protein